MANKTENTAPATPEKPALVADPEKALVTNDELLALHTAQADLIAELKSEVERLKSTAQVATSKPAAGVQPVVKIGSKEYRICHGVTVRHNGSMKTLTALEVAGDKELVKELFEAGSTAVEAV